MCLLIGSLYCLVCRSGTCFSTENPSYFQLCSPIGTQYNDLFILPLGGVDQNCGIFISNVERGSKAYDGGLKRGDQILEVNGTNFESISHSKALEVLRGTTLLSITVKSNLLGK